MFTCGTCSREFPAGWRSRQQHMNAVGHCPPDFECDTCDRYFGSEQAVNQHMNAMEHWAESSEFSESEEPELECDDCEDTFYDEDDLRDHETKKHFYCDPCDRYFQDYNSINQHLHSKLHRNTTVRCPFCNKTSGTATGLAHHLEHGSCPKAPLNRDKLYEAIRSRDPNGIISKKLLTWSGTADYEATERTWNCIVKAYQCYLCHRLFDKLMSLNQHLKSPFHQEKLYHCPNSHCRRDFTTLAAFFNHVESESCGYMRFEAVQENVERILDPRRMIQA